MDVCTAMAAGPTGRVRLRATAVLDREHLYLADYTCPVAKTATSRVAAFIVVATQTFHSEKDRERYQAIQARLPPNETTVIQVTIEGKLQCKADYSVQTADAGDIVLANGYGLRGLAKCRMNDAEVFELHRIGD